VVGADRASPPTVEIDELGMVTPVDRDRRFAAVPNLDGYFYEIVDASPESNDLETMLSPLLARLLDSEREILALAKQLAARYEEIELLYTISEILALTTRLEQAAETILREVSDVVGARRASIFVHDEAAGVLRPVATIGKAIDELPAIPSDDETSFTARAFRTGQTLGYDPRQPEGPEPTGGEARGYRGSAFLCVPIVYRSASQEARPVGVLNLTDRLAKDAFSGGERRLVIAVANQIGAALEHAQLVERDLVRQRVGRELELAHGLQLKLLASPDVLGPAVDVAARCVPARSVGGDFYHFVRLPEGRIGVMLGDVSSHGFAAALIMALVLSAAGIHAAEVASPDDTLRRLLESVADDLAETEMHLSLFYGVVDARAGTLRYANAGHPHAFRVRKTGVVERLGATSPPLGLTNPEAITAAETEWSAGEDLLLLFSDGIVEARSDTGEAFGEERVLELVQMSLSAPTEALVEAVLAAAREVETTAKDDRAILALRV
jgi:sigma-B regulation protein RsbU (phosphoserine phosphatase)